MVTRRPWRAAVARNSQRPPMGWLAEHFAQCASFAFAPTIPSWRGLSIQRDDRFVAHIGSYCTRRRRSDRPNVRVHIEPSVCVPRLSGPSGASLAARRNDVGPCPGRHRRQRSSLAVCAGDHLSRPGRPGQAGPAADLVIAVVSPCCQLRQDHQWRGRQRHHRHDGHLRHRHRQHRRQRRLLQRQGLGHPVGRPGQPGHHVHHRPRALATPAASPRIPASGVLYAR